jgi:hypothetical protein
MSEQLMASPVTAFHLRFCPQSQRSFDALLKKRRNWQIEAQRLQWGEHLMASGRFSSLSYFFMQYIPQPNCRGLKVRQHD